MQSPTLANGIAIYGGTDNTVSNNLVADPVREGSGLHAGSRFGATPFEGTLSFTNNTTVRAGTYELNWNIGLGAIWIYALDRSIDGAIRVTGDHYLDSTYNAIMMVSDWPVKDVVSITDVAFADVRVDGTGTSVLSARVAGGASFQNVDARNVGAVGINNCGTFHFTPAGSEFTVTDLGGNDGGGTTGPWMAAWELPNTITCDDRPRWSSPRRLRRGERGSCGEVDASAGGRGIHRRCGLPAAGPGSLEGPCDPRRDPAAVEAALLRRHRLARHGAGIHLARDTARPARAGPRSPSTGSGTSTGRSRRCVRRPRPRGSSRRP